MTDLGTLGGWYSYACDINTSGNAVGYSYISDKNSYTHAFRTQPNAAINSATDDLGTLGGNNSGAWGINSSGQIVGESHIEVGSGVYHAFIHNGAAMTDLNDLIAPASGWVLTVGRSINDRGQIVGAGYFNNETYTRAFVLTPITPMPEPSVWAMLTGMAFSAVLAAVLRRRRRYTIV
jgi:probable HAF family extracellular repeat protein